MKIIQTPGRANTSGRGDGADVDDNGADDDDWQVFIRDFGFTKEMQSP